MLRGVPSLSFRCLRGIWSSMVIRRVRLACDEEPCLGACCSAVFASVNVENLGCDDMLRGEPPLSFRCLRGFRSSMVIRCVRFACDKEPCLGACCSDVVASSINVEVLGCDDVLGRELSLGFCCLLETWPSTVLRGLRSGCDEDVVVRMELCLGARRSDVSTSSINTEFLDCVDELSGERSSSFCCPLGTWSLTVLRGLRFGRGDDVVVRMVSCSGVCCSDVSTSSFSATRSRSHRDGELAVNGRPLLNFCCLIAPGSLTAESRLRFEALRATSAPTVAMVLISNENSIVR